jgi:4-hydroxy-tetrahydrodipicolinate reductase
MVLKVLSEFPQFSLKAALVSPGSKALGGKASAGESRVLFSSDMSKAAAECDGFIDFSTPRSSLALARECAGSGKPLVVATTGFSAEERAELSRLSSRMPLLVASNTSLGVFVLMEACLVAQKLLGADFDTEVFEVHHRKKKDAPSGTALTLADGLARAGTLEIRRDRSSAAGARGEREVGLASLRGGDVVGDHTVFFLGKAERLELTHRVSDRSVFARGALNLLSRLVKMPAGQHTVRDLYSREL